MSEVSIYIYIWNIISEEKGWRQANMIQILKGDIRNTMARDKDKWVCKIKQRSKT